MNINEKLKAAEDAFKSAFEAGDAGRASELAEEVGSLRELVAKAAEPSPLDALKGGAVSQVKPAAARSLGEFAAKSLDAASLKQARGTVGTEFGFKAAADVHGTLAVNAVDDRVVDVRDRELTVRGLFGAEAISGNALTYFVMGATEGKPAVTAEGAAKPQIHVSNAATTAALEKIAAFFKESDEILEDAPFMVSAINGRGVYEHNLAVENYLVGKLLATSGIQTVAAGDSAADTLFDGMTRVQLATGYSADALVINPADYQALRLAKDGNQQYYGGGYFYGGYGSGAVSAQPGVWGLPTVVTPAVAKGTAIVGAFKAGGSVVTKAGSGLRVELTNADQDDFTTNRVTVRVEERLLLATRVPAAFAKVALA
ncbi:phage major capsid protein [Eggerthellaceae bacterium zg-997]|nr:phage major capsid protein [Eggerthellaceae bacterium zg-997]